MAARLLRTAVDAIDAVTVAQWQQPSADALRGRLLLSLAHAEAELGRVDAAHALLDRCAGLLPEAQLGVLSGQRGLLLLRTGRAAAAVPHLDLALTRLAAADHPVDRAKALLNRSVAQLFLGRLRLARADLLECEPLAQAHNLTSIGIKVTQNLGFLELLAGNVPSALTRLDEAARRCAAELPSYLPVIMLDKARALLAAGLTHDADGELDRALTLLSQQRLTEDRAEAELTRAQAALLADDPRPAARWARLAQRRFARRANSTWSGLAELTWIRAALASGAASAALARRAATLARRLADVGLVDDARVAQLSCAQLWLRARDRAGARSALDEVGRLRRSDPLHVRMLWWLAHAELAAENQERQRCSRQLRSGFAALQQYRSLLGSLDLQTGAAAHGRDLTRLALRIAVDGGRAAAIFAWAERVRAQTFRLTPARPPADPWAAQALEELRHLRFALRDAELRRKPTGRLRTRCAEAERSIRERAWFRAGAGQSSPLATLAQTRAELGDHAMVRYLSERDDLTALVVTARKASIVHLGHCEPAAELCRRIQVDLDMLATSRLPDRLTTVVLGSLRRDAELLAQQMLAPLLPIIGDRELVILPSGFLYGVPWLQLPANQGRPVVVAPSATAWLAARHRPESPSAYSAVVAGPRLDHSDREVDGLAAIHPRAVRLTGTHATVADTLDVMDGAALIHIAAHGRHQPDNPLFSSLELADGDMMGHDLDQLRAPPGHVVLSACNVGRSSARYGDEILGMVAALLHRGCTTVVASVTRVADYRVPDTMIRYHRGLRAGQPPASALANASAEDVAAPFVCFGAG